MESIFKVSKLTARQDRIANNQEATKSIRKQPGVKLLNSYTSSPQQGSGDRLPNPCKATLLSYPIQLFLILDDLLEDVVGRTANRNHAAVDHQRGSLSDIKILGQLQ
jgi:hypothetical protein